MFRRCMNPRIAYDERELYVSDKSSLEQWGSDAGYVSVATGPKFGCIHHKSK